MTSGPEFLSRCSLRIILCLTTIWAIPGVGWGQDYTVLISDGVGPVDGSATVEVTLCIVGDAIEGYQWGICHDADALGLEDDAVESFTDFIDAAFESTLVRDGGWTVGVLFTTFPAFVLEEGDYMLYEATYDLLAVGTSDLEFCDTLGTPPIIPAVLVGPDAIDLETENGAIEVTAPQTFMRGDVNGDGTVTAITDALFLLSWQFTGGEAPPCRDAADIDDSGGVVAIVDALAILSWAFVGGDEPPDPGPNECGEDPSDDSTDCSDISEECS